MNSLGGLKTGSAPFKKGDNVVLTVTRQKARYEGVEAEVESILKGDRCKVRIVKHAEWKVIAPASLSSKSQPVKPAGEKPLSEIFGKNEDLE